MDEIADAAVQKCLGRELDRLESETSDVVLLSEHRAEEWHFDEAIFNDRLQRLRSQNEAFKERIAAARERKLRLEKQAQSDIDNAISSATGNDLARAQKLSHLREELVDTRHTADELREKCEAVLEQQHGEVQQERLQCDEVEQKLRHERSTADQAARDRIAEIEDRESKFMREKQAEMNEHRRRSEREVLAVHRNAESRVRELEAQLEHVLEGLRVEMADMLKSATTCAQNDIHQRVEAMHALDLDVVDTDKKVRAMLNDQHHRVIELGRMEHLQEIQARDFEHEATLRDQIDGALTAVGCAKAEEKAIQCYEKDHLHLVAQTSQALGGLPSARLREYPGHFARAAHLNLHAATRMETGGDGVLPTCPGRPPFTRSSCDPGHFANASRLSVR